MFDDRLSMEVGRPEHPCLTASGTTLMQKRSRSQFRQNEFSRLRPVGATQAKSVKLMAQPRGEQTGGDNGALAPRGDLQQREGLEELEGQKLRERVGRAANLHPQFQRRSGLLPQIVNAPPALEIVKQWLDAPALTVVFDDLTVGKIGFGGQHQPRPGPFAVLILHFTPHRSDLKASQKSRHGNGGAQAYLLFFTVKLQDDFSGGQSTNARGSELVAILAWAAPAFAPGKRRRQKQRGVMANLSDDPHVLLQERLDQGAAHVPAVDEQAHALKLSTHRLQQLPGDIEFSALAGFGDQPGAQRHGERRTDPHAQHHGEGDPALAVQEGGSIDSAGMIVAHLGAGGFCRTARHQGIVDDQGDQLLGKDMQDQLCGLPGESGDIDQRPLDQFVIGGPMRTTGDNGNGAGDPALGTEHGADEQFDEGAMRTRTDGGQQEGNPL